MLTGLGGGWKCSLAYFFTAGLSAESQLTLTMDGHQSNVAMTETLGATLEPLKIARSWYFSENNQQIFITFYACHLIKLTRNMLQAYQLILDNGNFFQNLNELQNKHGVHLANKITDKHINVSQQKMKVSLACQTLSDSVAKFKAMGTLAEIDKKFKDCGATVKFIEVIYKYEYDSFYSKRGT
jgi:hypothetical protein